MHADTKPIGKPGRTWRRAGWVLGLGAVAGAVYFLVSDSTSIKLTDGTTVRYSGFVRGEALPHSEFEEALHAYSADCFDSPGIGERLQRAFNQSGPPRFLYFHAPLLLMMEMRSSDGGEVSGSCSLEDEFGASQTLLRAGTSFVNKEALPRRSPLLSFRIEGKSKSASGILTCRNPYYHHPTPSFAGKKTPVSATTAAGTVQLRRAVWKRHESEGEAASSSVVELEFDVSQCGELMPCHVVGIRITDCWGNSQLADGSLTSDGQTIRAQPALAGSAETALQDSHWRVRLALCRGVGAKVPPGRTAVFESIPMGDSSFAQTRAIGSQQVVLRHLGSRENKAVEGRMKMCFAYVQLPGAGVDDWPMMTRVTGHLAGGGSEVFDPQKVGEEFGRFNCRPVRVFNDAHGPTTLATLSSFDIRYWVPATYESVDLQFAVERPEVFEFEVQVADWPEKAGK